MANNVRVIFLQYTPEHQASGMEQLTSLVGSVFPNLDASYVIVDNSRQPRQEQQLSKQTHLTSGDNTCREFTGYDVGIRWFESYGPINPETPVVVANDSFHRSYGSDYLRLFQREFVQNGIKEGGIVGYLDAYPRETELFGYSLKRWVRTSLIVVSYGVLRRLLPFFPGFAHNQIFRDDLDSSFFKEDAPLADSYKEYLRSWLFAEPADDAEFKFSWHSKVPLTSQTVEHLRHKASCILCEHLFSAKAVALNIPLLAVNHAVFSPTNSDGCPAQLDPDVVPMASKPSAVA